MSRYAPPPPPPQSQPIERVVAQPRDLSYLFAFNHEWHYSLLSSFKPCPKSAFACFCTPCYIAKVIDRTNDNYCIGFFNPYALMALRTKVRTSFRIRGNLVEDCLLATLCLAPCTAMQIDHELDCQGIPTIAVQTRPGDDIWRYDREWKQTLFNCCASKKTCCLVCWCCPCKSYTMYSRAGENCLAWCWPMTLWSLRTKIRTLFRLRGSICGDCAAVHCCACCAIVQMNRELDLQGL
ncbi:hypothetical protein I4U23_019365 [Adineta vaga]|nr:hypothetical protein I4U23_019365 [Adineta vaga]